MDWDGIWGLNQSILETVLRGTFIFWFLYIVFRLILRRNPGSVSISDVLFVVIISEAIQNPMAGQISSLLEAVILVGTLVFWNTLLDWLCYRYPTAERILQPPPLPLIRQGRILYRNLRREFISIEELNSKLREGGVENIADVKVAYMEPNGSVTVVKKNK